MSKAHTLKCAAHNLGLLLRKAFGYCKPRNAEAAGMALFLVFWAILIVGLTTTGLVTAALPIALLGIWGLKVLSHTMAALLPSIHADWKRGVL